MIGIYLIRDITGLEFLAKQLDNEFLYKGDLIV